METYISENFGHTQRIGKDLAKKIKKGTVLTLYGDLGSGKTTFVQGLARGLTIKQRITSPTFIVVRQYQLSSKYQVVGIKYFYHIDLYRVKSKHDLEELGIDEILNDSSNIIAIEWAEKMKDLLPKERIDIKFEYVDEEKRKIIIKNV